MKKTIAFFTLIVLSACLLYGCASNPAPETPANTQAAKTDQEVTIQNDKTIPAPVSYKIEDYGATDDRMMDVDSSMDYLISSDLTSLSENSTDIIRGTTQKITYTGIQGTARTMIDVLVTEVYAGTLKKGDLITICVLGGYIPLREQIDFFDEAFRYEPYMTAEEIDETIVKETFDGEELPQENEDCLYFLALHGEETPIPNGVYGRTCGRFAKLFAQEGQNGLSFSRSFADSGKIVTEEYTLAEIQSIAKSVK